MKLRTGRGDFESFQLLRAAYLKSDDGADYWLDPGPFGANDWEPDKLHISELGACPRAIAYRLLGKEEKPRGASAEANRTVMFSAAYRLHYLGYSAMYWAGILVDHEQRIGYDDPWTGRCDALFRPDFESDDVWLYDMKTVLPNALKYRYDMPKEKDCLQIGGYALKVPAPMAVIESVDRAGSNTPCVSEIQTAEWTPKAQAKMDALTAVYNAIPEMPEMLPQVYNGHYSYQGKLTSVTLETDWRCSYCSFHATRKEKRINPASGRLKEHSYTCDGSLCRPKNDPPLTVAEWKDGKLLKVKAGHEDGVEQWLASHVTTVPVYTEED